jgi:putative transposase
MPLWRTYYHFVWATTQRQPLISEEVALILYNHIIGKATALGCVVHAIGGVEDHIHLLASVPPHLSLAQFVKHIKGGSVRYLNDGPMKAGAKFGWQRGYGVFSLSSRQVEPTIDYIANQRRHHEEGTLIAAFEKGTLQEDGPVVWDKRQLLAEESVAYLLEGLE